MYLELSTVTAAAAAVATVLDARSQVFRAQYFTGSLLCCDIAAQESVVERWRQRAFAN